MKTLAVMVVDNGWIVETKELSVTSNPEEITLGKSLVFNTSDDLLKFIRSWAGGENKVARLADVPRSTE